MENLTYAELVAILGEEAANAIMEQRKASEATGTVPFKLVKPIAEALGNELGNFGEFVLGAAKDKGADTFKDKGINFGKSFQFILVSQAFYYSKYVEVNGQGKTLMSSMCRYLGEIKDLVDNTGVAMPSTKEARDAANWKLVRANVGLIRADDKDTWKPCIWEVKGTLLFGFNELAAKSPNGTAALSTIFNVTSTHKKQGSTVFVTIDENASSVSPLDASVLKEISEDVKDITVKVKDWVESRQVAKAPKATQTPATGSVDEKW